MCVYFIFAILEEVVSLKDDKTCGERLLDAKKEELETQVIRIRKTIRKGVLYATMLAED